MKKIIFVILFCLILCGCSVKYNLEIDSDSFKEIIDIKIDKSMIPEKSEFEEVELDDQVTPFLEENTPVLFSSEDVFYNKEVQDFSTYYDVKMSYEYLPSEFKDSNSLNLCFDKFKFEEEENYYIHATGTFYCLYSDEITINITTKNDVIKNNADKVSGNTYTWNINNMNKNNVDIEFEVSKKVSYFKYVKYIILLVLIGGIIYLVNKLINKNKESNTV